MIASRPREHVLTGEDLQGHEPPWSLAAEFAAMKQSFMYVGVWLDWPVPEHAPIG